MEEKDCWLGAHGANVKMGKQARVYVKFKVDAPWLVAIHCLPHRLELTLLNAQWKCEYVEKVYDTLYMIWQTYHCSPKSARELKALENSSVSIRKPNQVKDTCWLPHVSRPYQ